jgi:hypothetical protein
MEKYNCKTAKNISLVPLMAQLGYAIDKKKGDNYWYKSPFKPEKTASFKINTTINKWFDFSLGSGGDTIEFVKKLKGFETDKALEFLSNPCINFFSFQQPQAIEKSQGIQIVSIKPIKNMVLIKYLNSRGIFGEKPLSFCCEVEYLNVGRTYKSIGFKNSSNGFELRSEKFKSCFGKKDYTFYDYGYQKLSVFEGFMDFLSYLMLSELEIFDSNYLILNSLTMINRVDGIIERHKQIYYFLDNDQAGNESVKKLKLTPVTQIDMSIFYSEHKDLNDYLVFIYTQSHE